MSKETMEQQVQDHGDMLQNCCLEYSVEGQDQWTKGIVKKVIAWWDSCGEYACDTERDGVVFFITDKDRYAVLSDSEDYTGHG